MTRALVWGATPRMKESLAKPEQGDRKTDKTSIALVKIFIPLLPYNLLIVFASSVRENFGCG